MSRKRSLQNSVFIVNDNCTENNKNDIFPLTLPNSDANGPPETGKAIGTTREVIQKLSGDLAPVYSHNKFYWYSNSTPRMVYPSLRTAKEDDNDDFQLSSASAHQLISSSKSIRARILLIALGVLGAECLSTPRVDSANKTREENVKCPSTTREDTNSQRPTHVQALSDD